MTTMSRARALVLLGAAALLVAGGCAGHALRPAQAGPAVAPAKSSGLAAPTTTVSRGPVALPTCGPVTVPSFDTKNFAHSTTITSRWMPLVPGTRTVLEGRSNADGTTLPHKIVFTVTDLVKVIDGVPNLVTWDVDYDKNTVAEAELAFFAQDNDGNVWNFGEYPEEYAGGAFTGAPRTWLAGLSTADAGVQVPAEPRAGQADVLQGSAPGVHFLDCAKDFQTGQHVCVPTGCYDDVRVMEESSPLDSSKATQHKYYAPGVGNIKVTAVDDPEGETLVLAERTTLSSADLAAARQAAMTLDQHGHTAHDVYHNSQPLQFVTASPTTR